MKEKIEQFRNYLYKEMNEYGKIKTGAASTISSTYAQVFMEFNELFPVQETYPNVPIGVGIIEPENTEYTETDAYHIDPDGGSDETTESLLDKDYRGGENDQAYRQYKLEHPDEVDESTEFSRGGKDADGTTGAKYRERLSPKVFGDFDTSNMPENWHPHEDH